MRRLSSQLNGFRGVFLVGESLRSARRRRRLDWKTRRWSLRESAAPAAGASGAALAD